MIKFLGLMTVLLGVSFLAEPVQSANVMSVDKSYMRIDSVDIHEENVDEATLSYLRENENSDIKKLFPDGVPTPQPRPPIKPAPQPTPDQPTPDQPTPGQPTPTPIQPPVRPPIIPTPKPPDDSGSGIIKQAKEIVDGVMYIGEKIWKVFEGMTPIADIKTKRASVLPVGIQHWTDTEKWSDLQAKKFVISARNGYNMEVIRMEFLVTYTYGGQFEGKGQYLTDVGFLVKEYYIAPLYTLASSAQVERIQNVGTRENPIAAIEISFSTRIENVLFKRQSSMDFYIKGDGSFRAVNL